MNRSFPRSPDQLGIEWLSNVLGTRVHSFDISPLGEGVGILGLVMRIHLTAEQFAPTLIAKFPSPYPENRQLTDTYNLYFREYVFYTQLADQVPIRTPVCHHADFDHTNNDFILLLEDLQGYRLGDQIQGCSADEARLVVDSLADLHKATWQPEGYQDLEKHNSEAQIQGMTAGFSAGWPVVAEKFPHLIDKATFDTFARLPEKVEPLVNGFCEPPLCVAHGDVRLDNIFFGENEIVLVDFQAICRSAPEHDLAYFLTHNLGGQVRSAEDWVARYHKRLTSDGLDYGLEACRERYRHCALYLLCYAVVICSALDMSNQRGRQLAATLLGNSVQSMRELNTADLLESL